MHDRACVVLAIATIACLALRPAHAEPTDRLIEGFRVPPASARPHTWWHWMNGNVTHAGIRQDLEWMQRVGFGGFQWFQVDLDTPSVVEQRVEFGSPQWRDALGFAAVEADRLGLEMALATSPGWSATGGPWVEPGDAMQKLVWSSVDIDGGTTIRLRLPPLPDVAGPYQDVPVGLVEAAGHAHVFPAFSADVAVLAWPVPAGEEVVRPAAARTAAGLLPPERLVDRRYGELIDLPVDAGGASAWIDCSFADPRTVRSVSVGLPAPRGFGAPPPLDARLEASADGVVFAPVVELPASTAPVRSAGFAPVTARHFRLVLEAAVAPAAVDGLPRAPGARIPEFGGTAPRFAISEWTLDSGGRVHYAAEKAGFDVARDYYVLDGPRIAGDFAIERDSIVDLTNRLDRYGTLEWMPPAGRWRIVRFGHSPTGKTNGPAPREATGLEVDKLDGDKVDAYLARFFELHRPAFDASGAGRRALLSDSIESGPQNWSPALPAAFRRMHGYDLRPWLPVLSGVVVGSVEDSDRFLWDFRRTIAGLVATNHHGRIAAFARARGLGYYAEALEDRRPQLGDDLEMRKAAEVPMGALWWFAPGTQPRATLVADLRGAASVAHVYGRPFVAAESLTAFGYPWAIAPREFKATVDLAFALGVNRVILHTAAHQPLDGRRPGLALAPFLGQYLTRHETWAEMARGFTDYLARSSYLLQQGQFVADIAYFYGEEGPVTGLYGEGGPAGLPEGHGFDFVGSDALHGALSVANGRLRSIGGTEYRLLYLGGSSQRLTLATLARIDALVRAGAVLVGERPLGSPSLADDAQEFARLAHALWPRESVRPHRVGAGQVWTDVSLQQVLAGLGVPRDWEFEAESTADRSPAVLHRRLDDGDLYFVSNPGLHALSGVLTLRAAGRSVEIWRADEGSIEAVSWRRLDGRTELPLRLEPLDAVFVLLRGAPVAESATVAAATSSLLATLQSGWRVRFGTDPEESATGLHSWTESADPQRRYFSGTAHYRKHLDVPANWLGRGRILLDLGAVHEVAEVLVDGRSAGIAWKPPYRLDLTELLRPGRNSLEVRVANLWANRLIGDAQPGATAQAYTTAPAYRADAPLRASGLLGPVRLHAESTSPR